MAHDTPRSDPELSQRHEQVSAGFVAVFVTFVLLTNTVGVKLFTIWGLTLPVSVVWLFHFWKRVTRGRHLWLRNNGSTMISRLVDSFTVNFIFLYKNPTVFTGGFRDLLGVILGVYLVKVVIAAADTPLCYLGVWGVRRITGARDPHFPSCI